MTILMKNKQTDLINGKKKTRNSSDQMVCFFVETQSKIYFLGITLTKIEDQKGRQERMQQTPQL